MFLKQFLKKQQIVLYYFLNRFLFLKTKTIFNSKDKAGFEYLFFNFISNTTLINKHSYSFSS